MLKLSGKDNSGRFRFLSCGGLDVMDDRVVRFFSKLPDEALWG